MSTLEILTEISRLSRQLSENEIQPEDDNVTDTTLAALDGMASPPDEEPMSYPKGCLTSNGDAEEIIPGNFELTTCSFGHDNERNNLASLKVGHSMSTEPDQLSLEEKVPVVRANEDAVTLGRTLFEEDMKLRRSFITEFQERLRKNEMCLEMKSKGLGVSSNKVSNGEISSLVEGPRDEASQSVFGKNNVAIFGGEDEEDKDQSDRKKEYSTASCEVSKGHENPGIIQNDKRKESENRGRGSSGPEPLINSVNQKRTGEDEASNDETAIGKPLPSPGDMNVIANEPCGVSTSDFEAGLYHCHREGTCKVQMGTTEIYQDEVFEESLVDRNGVLQKRESIETNDKDKTQSKYSVNRNATENDVPKERVEDGGEASVSGSLKKNFALFDGDQTRSLALTELAIKVAESHVESQGKMFPRQLEDGKDSDTCGELGQEAVKNGWDKEFSIKAEIGTSVLPLLPSESRLTVGCSASNSPPQSSKDVVDGPNSPNSNTQDQEKVETSVQPLSPGENDAESDYPRRPFSQTSDKVFSAPPFLISEDNSKDWMQPKSQSTFYGGAAVADGYTPELPSQQSEHVAVSPALKAVCSYQTNVKKERIILEGGRAAGGFGGLENIDEQKHIRNHCPNNLGDPDVIDGPVEQTSPNYRNFCHLSPNFGGARPKQGFFVVRKDCSPSAGLVDFTSAYPPGKIGCGLDPEFVERHAVNNSVLISRLYNTNVNGATWGDPQETIAQEHYFSARTFGTVNSMPRLTAYGSLNNHLSKSNCRHLSKNDVFAGSSTIEGSVPSKTMSHVPVPEQDKSWHFPSPRVNSEHFVKPGNLLASDRGYSAKYFNQETWLQDCEPLFDDPASRSPYQEMRSLADEYMIEQGSQGEALEHSESCTKEHSFGVSKLMPDSNQESQETLLECLRTVMSTTVNLFASNNVSEGQVKQDKNKNQQTEKLSIQEEAVGQNCDRTGTDGEEYLGEQAASLPRNERTTDTEEEDHTSPVQESPRPACGHYQRRCLVRFPCCGRFYPCHRCHNESAACTDDQARAINATHIRCTVCYHEQVVRS